MDNVEIAKTVSIKCSSRVSACIDKNYYTVEYTEERSIDPANAGDEYLATQRELLWDTVNHEVDCQIEDIYKTFAKR